MPSSLDCPRGGRLEMEQDPEGQSRGYMCDGKVLAILQVWGIV